MSTTIYLIRHAEAEGNLYRRIQGQYNAAVTDRGMRQIKALEKRFSSVHVDRVYSSDLDRTKSTAAAIYKNKGLELITTPLLREVNVGIWEDRTWGEMERADPIQMRYFNKEPDLWHIEGSESHFDLEARIYNTLMKIAEENDGKAVAVVSHGMAIRALIAKLSGIGPKEISTVAHYDNTSVTELLVENGKMTIVSAGDNSHLPNEDSTFFHQDWWKNKSLNDSKNVRYEPFDFENDREYYEKAEKNSVAAGDVTTFLEARAMAEINERSAVLAVLEEERIGVLVLDTEKGADKNEGWMSLYFVEEAARGRTLAVQYLGHASSVYRALGRKCLCISVNENDEHAIGFFGHYGFIKGECRNGFITLEKSLATER